MVQGDSGASKDTTDPMVGKVLNERFSIIEVIGTGGMGRVYKAIQSPLDRVVALKVLNPHYGASGRDPNFQKRFFLEASLTSKLRSPNTITVHDYGRTEDGIYYIAMEFVDGQTLAQVLTANGPLPWQRVLQIAQQICRSLREAHKNGIIHRDLKPANVMLLSEEADHDQVKVLDFGLVKSMATQDEPEITQAGMMLGSPLYMAPEQAKHIADARSDIYSLGVVIYQMLMGRPPFIAKESVDAIVKHISEPVPRFAQVRPDLNVPAELEAVVLKCLAKKPEQRFQSMDELLEGLRNAAHANGISGLFSDPRTVSSAVVSGSRVPPTDSQVGVTRAERSLPPRELPSEISVVLDDEVPEPRAAPSRKLLFSAVFAASLLVGAGGVFWATRGAPKPVSPTPAQTSVPPTAVGVQPPVPETTPAPKQTPEPEPADVRFHVVSDPPGAAVLWGEREVGNTPVVFEVPPDEQGVAEAKLTLSMDGYQSVTVTASGHGPEVSVSERLQKVPSPSPSPSKKKHKPRGYKDDPYQ